MDSRRVRTLVIAAILILPLALAWSQDQGQQPPQPAPLQTGPGLDSAYAEIRAGFEQLKPIFQRGCYNCHSDQTDYPWYHSLPLIGSWMDGHIHDAREKLDFSNGFPFPGESPRQAPKLGRIKREISSGDMPLFSYKLVHWGAAPNQAEKDSIFAWVDRSLARIAPYGDVLRRRPGGPPPGGEEPK
jgi:hypothetical protein